MKVRYVGTRRERVIPWSTDVVDVEVGLRNRGLNAAVAGIHGILATCVCASIDASLECGSTTQEVVSGEKIGSGLTNEGTVGI